MGEPASDVGEDDVTQNNMSSTPPKTNIEHKNEGLKDCSSFQQGDFQVPLFFPGVYIKTLILGVFKLDFLGHLTF